MSRSKETIYLLGLAELVKQAQAASPIARDQIARAIGIDRGSFCNLIARRKTSSLAVAIRIARYFEVPIETLLDEPKKVSEIVST